MEEYSSRTTVTSAFRVSGPEVSYIFDYRELIVGTDRLKTPLVSQAKFLAGYSHSIVCWIAPVPHGQTLDG